MAMSGPRWMAFPGSFVPSGITVPTAQPAEPAVHNITFRLLPATYASMPAIGSLRKERGASPAFLVKYYRHILCVAFVALYLAARGHLLDSGNERFVSALALVGVDDGVENAAKVKAWRSSVQEKCAATTTTEDFAQVKKLILEEGFASPSLRKQIDYTSQVQTVKRCKNVVIDFGADVGDSIGKIIDGGLPGCDKRQLDTEADKQSSMKEPTFLQGEERIAAGRWNGVSKYFRERLVEADKQAGAAGDGPPRGPEDYCMYGIEGNPTFTKKLQSIEQYIMSLQPRPLRHLHVFTETVGAGKDEPTEIYLDTVNEDKNFWGSSIIASHRDVQEGAAAQSDATKTAAKMVATPVQGKTLTSLMKDVLSAFAEDGDSAVKGGDSDRSGGHLFVKIDIEGGEYQLVNEAYDSGILCDYVKRGNMLDLLVEFHTEKLIGRNDDLRRYYEEVKENLLGCGVNVKRLPGGWA